MKLLMCRPDFYRIEYEINPWMSLQNQVNHPLAIQQWDHLFKTLQDCGAHIEQVTPIAGLPDLIFTANAGLLYHGKIILSSFKYPPRQKETPYYKAWFQENNFALLNDPEKDKITCFFEGAGDALFAGNKLFVAYGFRSDRHFYERAPYLKNQKLIYCELINDYFYHLDTCFCPLNENLALWYPEAFSIDSQKRMSQEIELLPVAAEEAKHLACNAVVLGQKIVLPSHCSKITTELKKRGFEVYACEMSEFIKAGAACKCLTLALNN